MLGENTKTTIDDLLKIWLVVAKSLLSMELFFPVKQKMGKKMSNIASDKPNVIIKIDGLAIFKGGKMIGWIEGNRERGIVWVMNKVKGTDVYVDWQGKKQAIGTIIRRSNVEVSAAIKNGKPVIQCSDQSGRRCGTGKWSSGYYKSSDNKKNREKAWAGNQERSE